MAKTSTVIDLDAKLGLTAETPLHTRTIRMFSAEWTVLCDLNSFEMAYISTGDPTAIVDFLVNAVIEEERGAFARAFAAQNGMDAERLGEILRALVEVMAERPTTPPSASGSPVASQTPGRKSGASTAAKRVVRSTS